MIAIPRTPLCNSPLGRLLCAALDDCWEVVGQEYENSPPRNGTGLERVARVERSESRGSLRRAIGPRFRFRSIRATEQNQSCLLAVSRARPRFMQPTRPRGMCRREANE